METVGAGQWGQKEGQGGAVGEGGARSEEPGGEKEKRGGVVNRPLRGRRKITVLRKGKTGRESGGGERDKIRTKKRARGKCTEGDRRRGGKEGTIRRCTKDWTWFIH